MTSRNEPAGVWVRVSTADQSEASQVPDVEGHCQAKGYRIKRRYELNDKSASKGEQQATLASIHRAALSDRSWISATRDRDLVVFVGEGVPPLTCSAACPGI